jgi:hypothetical protein
MATTYKVIKDFMGFCAGDIVRIYHTLDGTLVFDAERMEDTVFYGDENGAWGKNNSLIVNGRIDETRKRYMFVQEPRNLTVMTVHVPYAPYDKENYNYNTHIPSRVNNGQAWIDEYEQRCVDELIKLGVFSRSDEC